MRNSSSVQTIGVVRPVRPSVPENAAIIAGFCLDFRIRTTAYVCAVCEIEFAILHHVRTEVWFLKITAMNKSND